jgi:RNA polymerase sigma-32 factor
MSLDMPADESAEESYVAPASYLQQHGAIRRCCLKTRIGKGMSRIYVRALAKLDERSLDILSSRWLADEIHIA